MDNGQDPLMIPAKPCGFIRSCTILKPIDANILLLFSDAISLFFIRHQSTVSWPVQRCDSSGSESETEEVAFADIVTVDHSDLFNTALVRLVLNMRSDLYPLNKPAL